MKNKMVEAVPLSKKEGEENEQKKKLIDERDEENYDIEDDLICVRLTEEAVKNINLNEEINNNDNNNTLYFLGKKDNTNNNNNQWGNLNLLDLDSIFSVAAGTGCPNINNNNDNKANNNEINPFDLLNLQLNQPNNDNNNQSQNNNNINILLNMVIGTNNNQNNNIQSNNNDIFSQMQPNPTEAKTMKECFKKEDISLYYTSIKKEGSNIDGAVFATNHS